MLLQQILQLLRFCLLWPEMNSFSEVPLIQRSLKTFFAQKGDSKKRTKSPIQSC